MSLSPETTERVNHYRGIEELYRPNHEIRQLIGERTLHMVVAPAAMGKSLIMQRAAELDGRYGQSSSLSTRKARPDDEPGSFRLLEHTDENINALIDKIVSGELVQYKFHPTEHIFYGSEPQDHPHEHNMLPTLSGAINQLQRVGFKETTVTALVAPPTTWQSWFNARYPERHPQKLKRLQEAIISYNDLLLCAGTNWIVNHEGEADEAAKKLIRAGESERYDEDEALAYVHRILQLTEIEIERIQSEKYE